MKRKCSSCGEWNEGNDYCKYCKRPISPQLIREIEDEEDRIKRESIKKGYLDNLQEKIEKSKNPLVVFSYKLLTFLWLIYMGIISFITWLIAIVTG